MLDAQGIAKRVGCSPGERYASWIPVPVAVAPDAVYAITKNQLARTGEIDGIAR
jgi:hypothetical protein